MEVMKQLYDVSTLIDEMVNFDEVRIILNIQTKKVCTYGN